MRKLLQIGKFPASFWPLAALHASERNWHQMSEFLGQQPVPLLPFAMPVHGRKRFATGFDAQWATRTVKGIYLGIAPDTPGGHLIWVPGKVLLTNTVYPLKSGSPGPCKPKFRLTSKRSPHEPGFSSSGSSSFEFSLLYRLRKNPPAERIPYHEQRQGFPIYTTIPDFRPKPERPA